MPNEIEIRPLIASAIATLDGATSCAEILDAKDQAALAYDRAKSLARIKGAHDGTIAACHRIQADALQIEARARRRLADEYDAAQERGEVAKQGEQDRVRDNIPDQNIIPSTVADLGITSKQIHEARKVRDAEEIEPGIVAATVANARSGVAARSIRLDQRPPACGRSPRTCTGPI